MTTNDLIRKLIETQSSITIVCEEPGYVRMMAGKGDYRVMQRISWEEINLMSEVETELKYRNVDFSGFFIDQLLNGIEDHHKKQEQEGC